MAKYYANASDMINLTRFGVIIPEWYSPSMAKVMAKNPDYIPPVTEDGENSESMMTIAHMVDMNFNDVPFGIKDPKDVQIIMDTIDQYLGDFRDIKILNVEAEVFVDNVKQLKRALTPIHDRIKHRHHLKTGAPKETTLASLLKVFNR